MAEYEKYEQQIADWQGRAKHLTDTAVTEKREMTDSEVREHETLYGKIAATRTIVDDLKEQELTELRDAIKKSETTSRKERSDSDFFRSMSVGDSRDIGLMAGAEKRAWSSSSGASGTVTQEWHDQILSYAFEASIARKSGMVVDVTSHTHNYPIMTATGSATAVIVAENTAYTQDDPTISNVQMGAYKFVKKVLVAEEILADSQWDLGATLAEAAGVAFGLAENRYFVSASGTGTSTPSGVFALAASTSGAAASGITAAELHALVYGIPRQYRTSDACWYMNDATEGYIARLRTTASAVETLLWSDAINGTPAKLFGYPVYCSSDIASYTTASAKTIAFANPKYYRIGQRGPLNVKRLELSEYQTTFAFSQRMDGHPVTSSAFYVFTTSTT